ncbi:MAG: pyridoxal phosphate-dependent aminotransferase [Pseudomonadota bacterium]
MRLIASRLARVRPSPTVALTARVADMRAAGQKVIGLGAGEPDFDTPRNIRDAAARAMEEGHTRYTAPDGIAELKDAICEKFRRENGLAYTRAEITVGAGGKHVIYNALMATLDPGDEVIVPAPYWVSYPDMARLAGGEAVIPACGVDQGFRLTPAQLAQAITPRTKWLILNSPSNPTGAGYSAAHLAALAEVLAQHPQVHVICDDIYEHIAHAPFAFATLAAVAPALRDRCLVVNGVSKAYAMTGWRIGYGAGPAPLIGAIRTIQSQSTTNPSSISQWAAVEALNGPQDYIPFAAARFRTRRDTIVAALNACPGIDCPEPEGAFYVYPSIAGLIGTRSPAGTLLETDGDFATALLDETGVAIVPGSAFGMSPAFRVSYAAADDVLAEACARIAGFAKGCH